MTTKLSFLMRASIGGLVPLLLLAPAPAYAHFKLQEPADALQTDDDGDPLGAGGTQKMNPCGQGTASGAITTVSAGSTLHVKLTETVPHGGHYRIALLPKYGLTSADIPEPTVTPASGACDSAEIQSPVQAPVIADNLFPHTQAEAVAGKVWETDVQIPNQTGDATLQIIEFMTPHPPQCFYHHCAQLKIVEADAGLEADAGATADAGSDAATTDAGPGMGGGGDSGGCSVAGDATPSLVTLLLGAITTASMLRRRKRR